MASQVAAPTASGKTSHTEKPSMDSTREQDMSEKIVSTPDEKTEAAATTGIPDYSSKDGDRDVEKAALEEAGAASGAPNTAATVQVPLDRKQLVIMCIAMALAIFLISIDETVIVTAIPKITDQFHTIDDVGWYGSAYLLTMCCFQLHYGKFYKDYPAKWVFLISIAIFEIGSAICGSAQSSSALIVGRAIAGGGACGIISGVLIIIARTVPLRERPLYTAGVSSIRIVAGVGGPLLGGAITDSALTWRWCFYINLPFGAIVAAIFYFLYKPPHEERPKITPWLRLKKLDLFGLALFIPAMVCLIFALQYGGMSDTWNTPRIIVLFTLFGVFFLAFMGYETWLGEEATLPPRIAKNRTVISASFFVLCIDAPYYAIAYYLPIYFQAVLGVSALQSGIRTIPQIFGALLFSLMAGLFVRKTGFFAPVVVASSIITTIACGLLSTLRPDSVAGAWIGFQLLVGIGIGLGMQQAAVIVQQTLAQGDIPLGIAAVTFFQASGPAIMVAVAQNVFEKNLQTHLAGVIPGLTAGEIFNTGATNLTSLVPVEDKATVVNGINSALVWVWYSCTIIAALSVFGIAGMDWRKLNKLRVVKKKQ